VIESIKLWTCFSPMPCTYAMLLKKNKNTLKDFVGISSANLRETSLVHFSSLEVSRACCMC